MKIVFNTDNVVLDYLGDAILQLNNEFPKEGQLFTVRVTISDRIVLYKFWGRKASILVESDEFPKWGSNE